VVFRVISMHSGFSPPWKRLYLPAIHHASSRRFGPCASVRSALPVMPVTRGALLFGSSYFSRFVRIVFDSLNCGDKMA
jgi:hypothetical protein